MSNEEWVSPTDSDSRIAKMKDGRTHLAYKAEHVIDLETELVLAAPIYHADPGDADTLVDSVIEAQINLDEAGLDAEIEEAVADKGYHATDTLELADSLNLRTYIPEPKRKGETQLAKRAGGEAASGHQQSPPRASGKEQTVAASPQRTGGAQFRARVRQRGRATKLAARDRKGAKALSDCDDGPEPGLAHAQAVCAGHSEGLAGRRRPCVACLSCLVSPSFRYPSFVRKFKVIRREPTTSCGRRLNKTKSCNDAFFNGQLGE